jgi:peptidoglycan-associated lipoprotein
MGRINNSKEEKMRNKRWVWLVLFVFVFGLVVTVSCTQTKQATMADKEAEAIAAQEAEKAQMEEEAKQKALEEQRLREEREEHLRQERLKAEAEERAKSAAREAFVNENIYFDFDSAALDASAEGILREKAQWMIDNPGVSVIIEGHCDERGTNEYNLALGDRRAGAVKAYLINLGIDASRLTSISYGEERPVDRDHTEEAWAKNRRVHFMIE